MFFCLPFDSLEHDMEHNITGIQDQTDRSIASLLSVRTLTSLISICIVLLCFLLLNLYNTPKPAYCCLVPRLHQDLYTTDQSIPLWPSLCYSRCSRLFFSYGWLPSLLSLTVLLNCLPLLHSSCPHQIPTGCFLYMCLSRMSLAVS